MEYLEFHTRSAFSFLRGASSPEDLATAAADAGLSSVALLDRDGVYGTPRFFQATRDLGLTAPVGAEITLADGSVLPLLAATRTGYQNLCRLITTAKLTPRLAGATVSREASERKRPCFATWTELAQHHDGLIALTGDEEGPVRRGWREHGAEAAAAALKKLQEIYGSDSVYVEVQRHRRRGEDREVGFLRDLAAAHGLPLLATGGVTHATPAQRMTADVFACLRHHTTLDQAGRKLAANHERHLRSPARMTRLFQDLPLALTNTVQLGARLQFTLRDLGYRFPDFPTPGREPMPVYLRAITLAGAVDRYGSHLPERVKQQIDKELALIERLGFCGYFLIVWDICRFCRDQHILVQGRGSAANSVVCYALGITAIDPIAHRLLFERFLSEGRIGRDGHPSWPDIDLDLPSGERRERVIQHVYERYGERGAAMTANVITYRGRSAVREIGKVLGFPDDVLDRFSALYASGDFPQTLPVPRQLELAGLDGQHPRAATLVTLYQQLHGLPRHLGQHSGGMVICGGQLDAVVPLENASMPGRVVVQWDKDDCEELGIVKVDLLGLGMMAVLQDTFSLCQERGRPVELHTIPANDATTYAAMQRADTVGVFQIESRAQMATLPRLRPACFYDVAMQVAIVRPGPIIGHLTHPLIRRRNGLEPVTYLDSSVDHLVAPVLERTLGVILFQEQMLELAMTLACLSGSEAEELRRSMGLVKNHGRLERALAKLAAALRRAGRNEEVVRKVTDSAVAFAAYGFPESHALSFALLAYASTWLKFHRPAEFTASLLNNQPMGFYSPATLIQDARRHGLKVKPVCVLASEWKCSVEADDTLRIGLSQVRGLRETAVHSLLSQRRLQPLRSLADFLARSPFSTAELRNLAAVGALNALAGHRRAALWQIEAAWKDDESLLRRLALEEATTTAAAEAQVHPSVPLPSMTLSERLTADFDGMQLTTGTHPMALARTRLPDAWRACDLTLGQEGERVIIAGSVICRQRPGTAKGVVFVSLEDETGIANAIVSAALFEARRLVITQEPTLKISGVLQRAHGVTHVRAESISALTEADVPTGATHDFH